MIEIILIKTVTRINDDGNNNDDSNNNNNNNNKNNVKQFSTYFCILKNFFVTRIDDQLIFIDLKPFFFLLRSFSLIVSSTEFICEITHSKIWKLIVLLTLELYTLYLNIRSK